MLYIIRHGKTEMNSAKLLQGRSNYPLNEEGIRQAEEAADRLKEIKNLDGNILISTHAIAMKGILEYLTPDSNGAYWSKYIGNCSVYVAENRDCEFGVPHELI